MFSKESWKKFGQSILSLSERGNDAQEHDIKGLLPVVNNLEEQLREAKMGIKNKNPRHTPEDLTDAVVGGTVALISVAKEIDPNADVSQLRPNQNG